MRKVAVFELWDGEVACDTLLASGDADDVVAIWQSGDAERVVVCALLCSMTRHTAVDTSLYVAEYSLNQRLFANHRVVYLHALAIHRHADIAQPCIH